MSTKSNRIKPNIDSQLNKPTQIFINTNTGIGASTLTSDDWRQYLGQVSNFDNPFCLPENTGGGTSSSKKSAKSNVRSQVESKRRAGFIKDLGIFSERISYNWALNYPFILNGILAIYFLQSFSNFGLLFAVGVGQLTYACHIDKVEALNEKVGLKSAGLCILNGLLWAVLLWDMLFGSWRGWSLFGSMGWVFANLCFFDNSKGSEGGSDVSKKGEKD